jgi:hypothetical protein
MIYLRVKGNDPVCSSQVLSSKLFLEYLLSGSTSIIPSLPILSLSDRQTPPSKADMLIALIQHGNITGIDKDINLIKPGPSRQGQTCLKFVIV